MRPTAGSSNSRCAHRTTLGTAATTPAEAGTTACTVAVTHPDISIHQDSLYQGYSFTQRCGASDASSYVLGPSRQFEDVILYPGGMYSIYYSNALGRYTLRP